MTIEKENRQLTMEEATEMAQRMFAEGEARGWRPRREKTGRPVGRPPKPAGDRKHAVYISLNLEEHNQLAELGEGNVSAGVRAALRVIKGLQAEAARQRMTEAQKNTQALEIIEKAYEAAQQSEFD
jgi:hypothetical protein